MEACTDMAHVSYVSFQAPPYSHRARLLAPRLFLMCLMRLTCVCLFCANIARHIKSLRLAWTCVEIPLGVIPPTLKECMRRAVLGCLHPVHVHRTWVGFADDDEERGDMEWVEGSVLLGGLFVCGGGGGQQWQAQVYRGACLRAPD